MTREEIREGIKTILMKVISHTLADGYNDLDSIVREIQELEDGLGVVIKVDRTPPYSEYVDGIFNSKKKSQTKECLEKNSIYEKAQLDMIRVGYVAVKPLIET